MTIKGLVTVMVGAIAFVIIDQVVTSIITGTDTGSTLLQNLLRLIVAAGILIAVVRNLGGGKA